jgi:8-oxo-dGTP pyrophosphatase MutT (NUDIX family)
MSGYTFVLFILPDNRVVMQRRTQDAPYAPGKLGVFGGGIEGSETPLEGLLREIEEETSLNIAKLRLEFLTEITMPAGEDFPQDRHFYLHKAKIDNMDFEVYEGDGAEAFFIKELPDREDLAGSIEFLLEHFPTLGLT